MVVAGLLRPATKYFSLGVPLILLTGYLSSMERQLVNHRKGLCAAMAREENQVIKQGLAILQKRVLHEAERDGSNLPPLVARIDKVFNSILTEEGWLDEEA